MVARKLADGSGFAVFAEDCSGVALISSKTKMARCPECSAKSKVGTKFIKRSHKPVFEPYGACTKIGLIARDPKQAEHTIRSQRCEIEELRKQKARAEYELGLRKHGMAVTGADAENLVKSCRKIDEHMHNQLGGERATEANKDNLAMWQVFFKHLTTMYDRNGKKLGIRYDPRILSWSIVFLARTSVRIYKEVAKVLQLPHISYIYKLSNQIASGANVRAFSLCLQTLDTIAARRVKEGWGDFVIAVTAIDSASLSTGITWDYRRNQMVGQDESYKFEPMTNLFQKKANNMKEDDNDAPENSILDSIPLGKEHLVAIMTVADPAIKCCEVIGSTDVEKPSATVVFSMANLITESVPRRGLFNAANFVDAHGSNWSALLANSTHSSADFLPAELMDKYPEIDFGIVHIYVDMVYGLPVVNCPDPWHLLKNTCTALEKSWSKRHQRCIMFKNCPVHLGLIRDGWLATGGGTNELQPTKLTLGHFYKDNEAHMDVALSAQVFSKSTADMMQAAVDDDTVTVGNIKNKKILIPTIILLRKWNRLVDIFNGRDGQYYTPENGKEIQSELLRTLSWFSKWKKHHDDAIAVGGKIGKSDRVRTDWNFFADDTWKCTQMLILANVTLIQVWCIERGKRIHPRRLNTDPVEKHFGNSRQMVGGSRTGLTCYQAQTADAKSTLADEANFAAIGNNKGSGAFSEHKKPF